MCKGIKGWVSHGIYFLSGCQEDCVTISEVFLVSKPGTAAEALLSGEVNQNPKPSVLWVEHEQIK